MNRVQREDSAQGVREIFADVVFKLKLEGRLGEKR